jgi:DNA-binding MarR family transcriptional regulator
MTLRAPTAGRPDPTSAQASRVEGGRPQIPALVMHLGTAIRTVFDRRLSHLDLTMQQAALLRHCTDLVSPAQIAPLLGTDAAGMTRLVDRLEERHLVRRRRSSVDRRSILLEPAPAATAMFPEIRNIFRGVLNDLLAGFSEAERAQFLALLQRLALNVERAIE